MHLYVVLQRRWSKHNVHTQYVPASAWPKKGPIYNLRGPSTQKQINWVCLPFATQTRSHFDAALISTSEHFCQIVARTNWLHRCWNLLLFDFRQAWFREAGDIWLQSVISVWQTCFHYSCYQPWFFCNHLVVLWFLSGSFSTTQNSFQTPPALESCFRKKAMRVPSLATVSVHLGRQ